MRAERRTDSESQRLIARYRDQFGDGPVGIWRSTYDQTIGNGFDATGLFGQRIEFHDDGSGVLKSWGYQSVDRIEFRWRPVGPCEVLLEATGQVGQDDDRDRVRYDF